MVKNIWIVLFVTLIVSCTHKTEFRENVTDFLVPKPIALTQQKGYFNIDKNTKIVTSENLVNEASYLQNLLGESSNFKLVIVNKKEASQQKNVILLKENPELIKEFNSKESYTIISSKFKIEIVGGSSEGVMRGIQTLRQLFIDDFHKKDKRNAWQLPLVTIKDAPKFEHRGLLFDSGRHFFEVSTIKKYIDLLALYKMNVFHWHLTEDQGWRIAIDKYPKLTEIGAYRIQKDGSIYGGFYSKKQIKEVVKYASERYITVIPEIELPGHSQAALAAYPELSCTGNSINVANEWGVFKDIYCAGNEQTFTFLEDVLTEVMELFPSKYIHIGGDEAPKLRWESCEKCQQRIKDEHLADEHELQSYFIQRIEKFLHKNNRLLIGWDEILEGGLSPTAIVQSWRGEKGGIIAANNNQFAIMSPTSHCYFDYGIETTDLEKVYNFDPIPKDLPKDKYQYIKGSECNLWSEHIPTEANLDSKVFPRIFAMSEVLWTYPKERNFNEFYERIQHQYGILDAKNIAYGLELIPVEFKSELNNDKVEIQVIPKNHNFKTKYRWNCADCDTVFKETPVIISLDKTAILEIETYKNNKKYGANLLQEFKFHKAINSSVKQANSYNSVYQASGEKGLVDGKIGSKRIRDGNWQGFLGVDIDCVIDLGKEIEVTEIGANFLHKQLSWILTPKEVVFQTSIDGENWKNWDTIQSEVDPKSEETILETFSKIKASQKVRFVKLYAKNLDELPEWHKFYKGKAWLFIDEIFVK
ncbi:MAG: family 20 glycosylhydrolase [Lutibacter sp.]|uniref:glycoside hydrolase family 20 protein n=1 Tax=Lutibacter sp. TaxID=1925666 RepID=UPI0038582E3C